MGSVMVALIMFTASIALMTVADKISRSIEYRQRKKLLAEVPEDGHRVRAEYKCIRDPREVRDLTIDDKRKA
jgi:molybdopterin biosynthesis enzyme MoaB